MSWYSIAEAAAKKNVTRTQIYRLIKKNKIQSQPTIEGTQVWLDDLSNFVGAIQESPNTKEIQIPFVPMLKITLSVINKVNAMLRSISASENIGRIEKEIVEQFSLSLGTQHKYKSGLRNLFSLPKHSSLASICLHPQIRQALEYIVVRKPNANKGTLHSAKQLSIVTSSTGELISIEAELKSLYAREGANASSCYRSIKARCLKKQVVITSPPCQGGDKEGVVTATLEDLPSEASVIRFLRNFRRENIACRRGRSRKHDWEVSEQPYVTRDVTQYQPGELWIGDHTELDFMVLNENGKLDRRWITAFIDIRTGLLVGYNLNWQPCSNTIALAFRAGVLGQQMRAFTGDKYERVSMNNIPETVMMDNGKDYRSKYTKRVFGKIDFTDEARRSITRITKLHYTTPYHGQSKAQMERWFRTIQTMLKYLPGFKSNKYENKPDTLAVDIKQNKILTAKEFDAHVAVAIDAYNNRIHRSLSNQSPLQCYLTNQNIQRTIDLRVLDFLMLKVERKPVRRCQVHLFGEEYYSDSLAEFNGKHADVYYDPVDLGFISIYVDGEFAAVAGNKQMIGRDENGWKKILADRKHGEKQMQIELREIRRGVTDEEAHRLLLEGELLNISPVSAQLLGKTVPTITHLTGLEQEAKRMVESLKEEAQMVEIKKRARKRAVGAEYTLDNVINNIK